MVGELMTGIDVRRYVPRSRFGTTHRLSERE